MAKLNFGMIDLLVVDDDDINNFLLRYLLKRCSYEVALKTITNPAEAVSYVKQCHADNKKIDLILLDINMPLMTGWEVLNELRTDGRSLLQGKKVFMLSSSVQMSDQEQSANYDEVSGFISKPITLELLTSILSDIQEDLKEKEF